MFERDADLTIVEPVEAQLVALAHHRIRQSHRRPVSLTDEGETLKLLVYFR